MVQFTRQLWQGINISQLLKLPNMATQCFRYIATLQVFQIYHYVCPTLSFLALLFSTLRFQRHLIPLYI